MFHKAENDPAVLKEMKSKYILTLTFVIIYLFKYFQSQNVNAV